MKITKIEPKCCEIKRVAAYARVSTIMQEDSFESQCAYFTQLISKNDMWKMADVYSDLGKSGLSAEKRPGFQKMMSDARKKQFEIILCKSISRFARNAVEAQRYVNELRSLGIEVHFQREGINTADPSSEMAFNLLAAMAQEESRSISEKIKWANKKRAEKGIRRLGNNHILGYDEIDGKLVPNEKAWIVRRIFDEFSAGKKQTQIASDLANDGIIGLRGATITHRQIAYILRNEIYVGDRKIQKKAPVDYLTNKPDFTQPYDSFYFRDAHEPIVSRATWHAAQMRISPPLKGLIFCSLCGDPLHLRNRSGTKIWTCCSDKHKIKSISEKQIIRSIENTVGGYYPDDLKLTVERIEFDGNDLKVVPLNS